MKRAARNEAVHFIFQSLGFVLPDPAADRERPELHAGIIRISACSALAGCSSSCSTAHGRSYRPTRSDSPQTMTLGAASMRLSTRAPVCGFFRSSGKPFSAWLREGSPQELQFEKFVIGGKSRITAGKSEQADVCLDSPYISREHFILTRNPDGWVIEDRSRNGVYLDGRRLPVQKRRAARAVQSYLHRRLSSCFSRGSAGGQLCGACHREAAALPRAGNVARAGWRPA